MQQQFNCIIIHLKLNLALSITYNSLDLPNLNAIKINSIFSYFVLNSPI